MWIQLLTEKTIETNGINVHYHRGDWIEVGRQTAHLWIQQGIAHRPDFDLSKEYIDLSSGIVLTGNLNTQLINNIKQDLPGIDIEISQTPQMLFSENMIWSNGAKIKRENVMFGFKLLEKWQIAIPIFSYDILAIHLTDEQDKEYVRSILHDLRVPVYNTNLMFVRRCSDTQELFDCWQNEKQIVSDENIAFHIAYYKTKVLLNALPESWCK